MADPGDREAELDEAIARLQREAEALGDPAGPSPFWLSHHPPDEYGRTFRIGAIHVCARCLGTYPILLTALAAQILAGAPMESRADVVVGLGLLLPALVDWARGRFQPAAGTNTFRFTTGALLGLGIGRTLYLHLHEPFPPALVVQAVAVTAVGLPVIFATWRRRRGA